MMTSIYFYLQILFLALCASFWGWAASVRLPKDQIWFTSHTGGGAPNENIDKLIHGLRKQSRLNGVAAGCAAIAAVMQFLERLS
jgi:hypothetical protein